MNLLDGRFQDLESVCTRSQVPLLGSLPIDDIPDILDVCSLAVQVLQVISMFPHVDSENRNFALSDHRVLIFGGDDGKSLLLADFNLDQPAPSTSLYTKKCRVKSLFKFLFVAPRRLDLFDEFGSSCALGLCCACGCKILPEERVVDVSTSAELDALLQRNLRRYITCVHGFRLGLQRSVQVRDVRLMVLAVMQFHDLRRDVRFQSLFRDEYDICGVISE
jgi:hypothetical protein